MRRLLTILFLFPFLLCAQEKGVVPINGPATVATGVTRAVVVGISDYEDPAISDLRYAHKDAEAFCSWLLSPAGGNVPPENIQLLLNNDATKGKVAMALTWLYEQSREGDRAIIYFSGHGDVEKKLFSQPGYLLCWDAPPVVYMSGGTLSVTEIQEVVTTLSLVNKAGVLLITDACRAGTLVGAATGGPQYTTASMMNKFANEVKILSCQPSEFSIEGEQWGGGRGAFSFNLEDALYGAADHDKDRALKLKEIGRYLEDHVPVQTDPQVQNPLVIGDKELLVAFVDDGALARWEADKKGRQTDFSKADIRGMAELVLAQADSSIQQMYDAFVAALEAGNLMSPEGASANDYYEKLLREPGIGQLHGYIKRNLVAALVDEAQQVTNKLLKTDPNVVSDTWSRPFVYDHIPAYLDRAAAILGPEHFFYRQLKAKECYFKAKKYRRDLYPAITMDSLLKKAVNTLEEGLRYDSAAAYLHVDLGIVLFWRFIDYAGGMEHAKKALELSPNWAYAHVLAGRCYAEGENNLEQGVHHYLRALELDSTCLLARQELFWMHLFHGNAAANFYIDNYILEVEKLLASGTDKVPAYLLIWYGEALTNRNRAAEAVTVLEAMEQKTRQLNFVCYQFLYEAYSLTGKEEGRIRVLWKLIEINPNNPLPYGHLLGIYRHLQNNEKISEVAESLEKTIATININHWQYMHYEYLAEAYDALGRVEDAKKLYEEVLKLVSEPKDGYGFHFKGRALIGLGGVDKIQETIDEGLKKFPDSSWFHYGIACHYSLSNQEQKALEWLEKAFVKGYSNFSLLMSDADLENIRYSAEFKILVKKYFP